MYSIFEQLLQNNGISTYKVSKETGISQSVLSAWKTGISTPKQDKLQKIADFFGVTVDYLTGREADGDNRISLSDQELKRLQALKVNDKLRILFDETQKLDPSDIDFVLSMVERLKNEGKIKWGWYYENA